MHELTQFPEMMQSRAVEARWTKVEDGVLVDWAMRPLVGEVLMAWSAHFLAIVRQVGDLQLPVSLAVKTIKEARAWDVSPVELSSLCGKGSVKLAGMSGIPTFSAMHRFGWMGDGRVSFKQCRFEGRGSLPTDSSRRVSCPRAVLPSGSVSDAASHPRGRQREGECDLILPYTQERTSPFVHISKVTRTSPCSLES
jgi:hypothetical protein